MSDRTPIELTEAAGDWLDRLSARESTAADRRAFAEWVRTSPVHVAEFLRLSALHAELTGTLSGRPDWAQQLIDEANVAIVRLADQGRDADAGHGDAQTSGTGEQPTLSHRHRTRWFSPAAAAAAIAALTAVGAFWAVQPENARTIATELGEQRAVVLADGSTLQLNTNSIVHVSMDNSLREVELQHGELLVDVAGDPERIFRVRTDEAVVEAIGTRFNVYRRDEATEVTVVEGRVAVDWAATGNAADSLTLKPTLRELDAGLRLIVAQNAPQSEPDTVDLEKATAWTGRRLIFDEETVQAVAAEFNRYNRARVIVADPVLAERRISGVFDVDDPAAFVAMLGGLDAIEVQVTREGHRELRGRREPQQ